MARAILVIDARTLFLQRILSHMHGNNCKNPTEQYLFM